LGRFYLLMNRSVYFLLFGLLLSAQYMVAQKGPEVGIWLGAATYYGDINPALDTKGLGPAGGVNFRYNFNNRIAFKTSLNYIRINGDDSQATNNFQLTRNLSFFNNIFEMSNQMEFNFLPYVHGSGDEFYTPYLFGGITTLFHSPKTRGDFDQNGTEEVYILRELGTEGQPFGEEYGRVSLGFNYGFGLKFDINTDWSINLEFMGHRAFTDYLDDVSTTYPDFNQLALDRGEIAVAASNRTPPALDNVLIGDQRGNANDKDYYYTFGISIMRYFGVLQCPKVGKHREIIPR